MSIGAKLGISPKLDPVRLQEKSSAVYQMARDAIDSRAGDYPCLLQILAAHQSALARRHAGVTTEDSGGAA